MIISIRFAVLAMVSVVMLSGCASEPTLTDAAVQGDADQVRRMIKAGAKANEIPQGKHYTPLCGLSLQLSMAQRCTEKCYIDYLEVADILIAKGANVNTYCLAFIPGAPLHIAVQAGKIRFAKFLIKKGAKVNLAISGSTPTTFGVAVNGGDITPLMLASNRGDLEMVNLLMASGANPSLKDSSGKVAKDYYAAYLETKRRMEEQEAARREQERQDKAESRAMWGNALTAVTTVAAERRQGASTLRPSQSSSSSGSSGSSQSSGSGTHYNLCSSRADGYCTGGSCTCNGPTAYGNCPSGYQYSATFRSMSDCQTRL